MVCVSVLVKLAGKKYQADFTVEDEAAVKVGGAVVTVGTLTGTTSAAGLVSLSPFKKGTYQFTITHADYEDFSGSFVAG